MRRSPWLIVSACGLGLLSLALTQFPPTNVARADEKQAQEQAKQSQEQAKQAEEKAKQAQEQTKQAQEQAKQAQEAQAKQAQEKSQQAGQTAAQQRQSEELSRGMNTAGMIRANKFVGTEVRSREGEKLGDIEDLTFDMKTGRISYVAISAGGFLGIGSKLVAVPWNSLEIHSGESSTDRFVVLNVPKDEFRNAPTFSSEAWPTSSNQIWQVGTEREEMDVNVERQHEAQQHQKGQHH